MREDPAEVALQAVVAVNFGDLEIEIRQGAQPKF
jgi:hypothetical protein